MRNFTKSILAGVLCSMAIVPAAAAVYDYSPASPGAERMLLGYQTADHYDVGMLVPRPTQHLIDGEASLTKVSAMVVNNTTYLKNFKMWVSTTLENPGKGEYFVGDIANADVELPAGNGDYALITFTLDTPCDIPAKGLYVGYSFDVPNISSSFQQSSYPIVCTAESGNGSIYARIANNAPDWGTNNYALCCTASLEGNFVENSVTAYAEPGFQQTGKDGYITITFVNEGVNEVSSVDYTYTLGDRTVTDKATVRIPGAPGSEEKFKLPIEAFQEDGTFTGTLTINNVNNQPNTSKNAEVEIEFSTMARVPQHRPVVEEFTGTWCGWCTRGLAGMQALRDHVDDFIAIAYHGQDPMSIANSLTLPAGSGYPSALIDREQLVDPYYGSSQNTPFGIVEDYNARRDIFPFADVNATAEWNDDYSQIIVNTTTNFVKVPDDNKNFRLGFVLLQDETSWDGNAKTESDWEQHNYYSGYTGKGDPYLNTYYEAGGSIKNFKFNDVAIYSAGARGVSNSLPKTAELETYKDYEYSYTIDLDKCTATYGTNKGNSLVQNKDKMDVVVMVIRLNTSNGTIVNATKVKVPVPAAVENIFNNVDVVATDYYDLQGRKITNPTPGIYVKSEKFANGTVKSEKIVIK